MKTFLKTLGVGGIAAAVLLVPTSTPEAEPAYTVNFGTVAPDGTPWADQLRDTKKRVEKESAGAIKVKIFLGGSLGSEIEMVQDCRRGERLQGVGVSTGAMAEGANMPLLQLPELPYLFNSFEEADAVMDDVLFEPLSADMADKGFVLAIWAENGWRSMATKGGPASTPEELAQYKMRAQESPVHLNMYKALGVQAVSKPTSEVLPALNTGIVDGFDNTPLFSLAAGWLGPVDHYTRTNHIYQPAAVAYSKTWFDTLPADLQTVVIGDPKMEAEKGRIGVRSLEADLLATIEAKGVTVTELTADQRSAYAAKTLDVHKTYLRENPEALPLYKKVQAKLKTMR
ncbi:MAG: TRAP transporter substrate-binding protein [Proteobacteria bacterium]|nr:TRAP transporter substrate-binding protein [Pseudomonadota bacterium]MCP4916884.1 TRAP transporter substrate-binding protein [Pseudomonadota bacterium]